MGSRFEPRTDVLRPHPPVEPMTAIVEPANSIVTRPQYRTQAPSPKCITNEVLSFTPRVTATDSHGSGRHPGIKFA
ncbi:hypothetical protein BKA82DRAFT_1007086 [Pisolithus tinctorius]|uniref:Uncharacterized protein n=1 Tax=Pisolithus tinctorius Marx 270 TaxID=870435 RepID=A0A0C3JE79_PISTI|nr:hypothetical protein BKA82DRAFT_1007086 [Pisolithus tinctorius]KIN95931.1 hypothetical protein M404DRAFT_1007086 [Pisolithus tinctorius Marx 270]